MPDRTVIPELRQFLRVIALLVIVLILVLAGRL
jgi:hypothetical protein